jgi:hypothetical protein
MTPASDRPRLPRAAAAFVGALVAAGLFSLVAQTPPRVIDAAFAVLMAAIVTVLAYVA